MTTQLSPKRPLTKPPVQPAEIEPISDGDQIRMSLFDHLDELRKRLFRAVIALVIGTAIGVPLAANVLIELQKPYGREFTALGPTDSVIAYFRVALLVGAIISIPLTTYQILMFIVPGLTGKEKRYLLTTLPAITLLFLIGASFSWFVLVPPALGFLEGFQPTIFKPEWTADLYLSFVTALIFWMGVAFQTPLIFFILSLMGLVTAGVLVKQWRIAIVGAAVASALITPTIDPVNMMLVMGPLLTLYGLSIILVAIGQRFSRKREEVPA